jgi:hypothetical protein
MREPTPPPNAPAYEAPPAGEPRPRVEPALAASRRSFTAVSWASKLGGVSGGVRGEAEMADGGKGWRALEAERRYDSLRRGA